MPESPSVDDETSVVTKAAASAPPQQVWDALVLGSAQWWGTPYLAPDEGTMRMDAHLGGAVWSATDHDDDGGGEPAPGPGAAVSSDAPGGRRLHGTIRAFDPPERLEIGGVLVPGAYAGSITVTIEETSLGSEIRVEHMARGRVTASTEETIAHGWTQLTARLAELAEAGDPASS